jgi:hypothetical protein
MTKKYSEYNRVNQWDLPEIIDPGRIKVCFEIPYERYHIRAFWTALYKLTLWNSWSADDDHTGREAALVWRDVLNVAMNDPNTIGCAEEINCATFAPDAPFIEWFPNNPYTEPDLITDGYNAPAWYKATEASNLVLGTQFGDILTDLSRFPPGSLPTIIPASGLPRFRINLTSAAVVTIHLLNIFGGSVAQITIDDNISTLRFIDMDRDQIAVPFETATTTPVEVEVLGEGAHHIDVIVVSQLNDQIPFLHHGGGLRKVEICGEAVEMPYFELRQNPENACQLEQRQTSGGEWSLAFDYSLCDSITPPTAPATTHYNEDGILEGCDANYENCEERRDLDPRFNSPLLPPLPTAPGDTLRCEAANNVVGFMQDMANTLAADTGAFNGVTGLVAAIVSIIAFILGAVTFGAGAALVFGLATALFGVGAAAFAAAMTSGVYETLLCIVYCNTPDDGVYTESDWQAIKLGITTELTGIASTFLHDNINAFGLVGLNNASRAGINAGLDCGDCDCPSEWCYEWNFVTDDGDFTATFGTWTLGVGWVGTTAGTGKSIILTKAMASTEITHVEIDVTYADEGNALVKVGTVNTVDVSNVTTDTYSWNGSATDNDITLNPSSGASQGADVTMTRVLMRGTGANPFGDNNCE